MGDCCCDVPTDIPAWVPSAIAFGLSVLVAIAVIIAYIIREVERHKHYYGRVDKLSSREQPAEIKKKEEMDAYALGRCSDEVLVIKSPPQKSPGAPGTVRSGVKVMLRKKRPITRTPSKPPTSSAPTSLEPISPNVLNFTVVHDKTGRAFELVDLLRKEPLPKGGRTQRAETLLQQVKNRLETMTEHNFIVYGTLFDSKCLVKGLENLGYNVEEMLLQLRLDVEALGLKIMAYKIQACSAENALMMSMRARTSEGLRPEPTQATPGSRWVGYRGTPDKTPHVTPVPKSAELAEQERRSKDLLLHAAKNLRQVMMSPTVEKTHFPPASPDKMSAVTEKMKSTTRKSHIGTPKGVTRRSNRNREIKDRYHKPKLLAELTPTKRTGVDSKEKIPPSSPGKAMMMPVPVNGLEKAYDDKPDSKLHTVKQTQTQTSLEFDKTKSKVQSQHDPVFI